MNIYIPLLSKFLDKFLPPNTKDLHSQEKNISLQRVSFIQNLRTNIQKLRMYIQKLRTDIQNFSIRANALYFTHYLV